MSQAALTAAAVGMAPWGAGGVSGAASLAENVQAVALIPGTGEYALATRQVSIDLGLGETRILNRNTPMGGTDFQVSLATLGRELQHRIKTHIGVTTRVQLVPAQGIERSMTGKARRVVDQRPKQ